MEFSRIITSKKINKNSSYVINTNFFKCYQILYSYTQFSENIFIHIDDDNFSDRISEILITHFNLSYFSEKLLKSDDLRYFVYIVPIKYKHIYSFIRLNQKQDKMRPETRSSGQLDTTPK